MPDTGAVSVGLGIPTRPPLSAARWALRLGRAVGVDSMWAIDHFLGFVPPVIWDEDLTFLARRIESPDEIFDYQALLGYLAPRAGRCASRWG